MLAVRTIEEDYGSQKDFTQVWNTTMEGVRWAGRDFGVGKKKQGPTDHPPLLVSSSSAVASTTTQILRTLPTSKRTMSFPHTVALIMSMAQPQNPAPRRRLGRRLYRCVLAWKFGAALMASRVLKEGGRQQLTIDALLSLPRVASISFCMTSEPMQSLWVVWQLELGAWR